MMDAAGSSKIPVSTYVTTWSLDSEDHNLIFQHNGNFKSHKTNFVQNDGSVKEYIKICRLQEGISETVSICFTSLSVYLSCSM
jgi:hypothetical protein